MGLPERMPGPARLAPGTQELAWHWIDDPVFTLMELQDGDQGEITFTGGLYGIILVVVGE